MKLRLRDLGEKDSVLFDIKVDYFYSPKDLLAIFCGKTTDLFLNGNKKAAPYEQYCFKRVQNIISCSFHYKANNYTLKLGEYLERNEFQYFIISQETDGQYLIFDDYKELIEISYDRVLL